jgi:hypothetical protein
MNSLAHREETGGTKPIAVTLCYTSRTQNLLRRDTMFKFIHFISAALILFATSACSSESVMEEGMWEMTSKMEISGMAGMPQMPPVTYRQCLTNENMAPAQQQPNQNCEMVQQNISGDTVNWKMRCTNSGVTSEMEGTTTYTGDSMEGTMTMNSQGMKMVSHVTGKRVGDCN